MAYRHKGIPYTAIQFQPQHNGRIWNVTKCTISVEINKKIVSRIRQTLNSTNSDTHTAQVCQW
jgi:hypothetical protein